MTQGEKDERLSFAQNEELERQYITEVYNSTPFAELEPVDAAKRAKKSAGMLVKESEKLFGKITLASKIKKILFCPNGNFLCVGLQNGTINIYKVEVTDSDEGTGFKSCKL